MLGTVLATTSCENYFEMRRTNNYTQEVYEMYPDEISGLLIGAYRAVSSTMHNGTGSTYTDCSTDNAMPNQETSNNAFKLGNLDGYWTVDTHPLGDRWGQYYSYIMNANLYLGIGVGHDYAYSYGDAALSLQIEQRLSGEAYFLRAYCHSQLLRHYGGPASDGRILGVPLVTEYTDYDPKLERSTYEETVDQIIADLQQALDDGYLPKVYIDGNTAEDGKFNSSAYDDSQFGRANTDMCYALKSRVALMGASPFYYESGSKYDYAYAAQASLDAIDFVCGTRENGLPDVYSFTGVNDLFYNDPDSEEVILRRFNGAGTTGDVVIETANWPPTIGLAGSGRANPTQNLVDAFPMANGYPISDLNNSGYSADDMYTNRDPRFYLSIIYNKQNDRFTRNYEVQMYPGGNTYEGYGSTITWETTTRTGYYTHKWCTPSVILSSSTTGLHQGVHLRKAELYLDFAEAACQLGGPDYSVDGYTARMAIKEIRRRAYANVSTFPKISVSYDDTCLDSITDKEEFLELIKNERRIELCFEDHRWFDLRRWQEDLNTPLKVISFTDVDDPGTVSEAYVPIFKDKMYTIAIPNEEIQRAPQLIQNSGW